MSNAFLFCLAVFVVSLVAVLAFRKSPKDYNDPKKPPKRQKAKQVSFADQMNVGDRVRMLNEDSTKTGTVKEEVTDDGLFNPLNPISPLNPFNHTNPDNVFRDDDPTPAYGTHNQGHSDSGSSSHSTDSGHSHSHSDSSGSSHSSSDFSSSPSSSHSHDSGSYGGDSYGGHHSSSDYGGGFDGGSHGGHH